MSSRILTLYGRKDCPLCDDMARALTPYLSAYEIGLEVVDIDSDPALRAQFDWDVPLLFADKREICRHELDIAALNTWLQSG